MDREQRVHIRSVPSATLFRALACGCLALAPAACAQTVAGTQTTQENDPNAPKTEEALKTQCRMAQENKKNVNNLDAKIAAVDKCIADGKKHLPPAG
jgi:septal ring factor EnvC (AmiA/AmiB activator)